MTLRESSTRRRRYLAALGNLPASGGGGCHPALLRVANLGRAAGLSPEQVADNLEAHVHGTRRVAAREIEGAVRKAFDSCKDYASARTVTPPHAVDGAKLLAAILERGSGHSEADIWELSPVRIDWPPKEDAVQILRWLYEPEDYLFIGARHDSGIEHVRSVAEWIASFERGMPVPEHVIPNPLSGQQERTKDGKTSYRADACVARFIFAVIEFDSMPRNQQIAFWAGVQLPVVALFDSGGKSIHGWVRIDAADSEEWTLRVEGKLFSLLAAVGADGACKNEARLSRMPGHFRTDKKNWQRILYLNSAETPILP